MKHLCVHINDNQSVSYTDNSYFHKPHRIDKIVGVNQQFGVKFELKTKIINFHIQRNIQLEVTNNSKLKLVMKRKDPNSPKKLFATPNITGVWEIRTNPLEHSYYGITIKADQNQMTSRIIAYIIKNW
jgi:hypothetical protein